MILYRLQCHQNHQFECWLKNMASFEEQQKLNLLECPLCASRKIEKALTAPFISKKSEPPEKNTSSIKKDQNIIHTNTAMPAELKAMLQKARETIEKEYDYVGKNFTHEARRIHNKKAPARQIYGEATEEQKKELADDGIDFSVIPWIDRSES